MIFLWAVTEGYRLFHLCNFYILELFASLHTDKRESMEDLKGFGRPGLEVVYSTYIHIP